jgi:hypoxanthine phosphoribosyltransferase
MIKKDISWQVIEDACRYFSQNRKYTTIVAIGTGGLIPATIIHKCMPTSTLYNLGLKTRNENENISTTAMYQSPPTFPPPTGPVLVVDDIYDTGYTFKEVNKILERIWGPTIANDIDYYAVFLSRKSYPDVTKIPPCLHSLLVDADTWLNFPWE